VQVVKAGYENARRRGAGPKGASFSNLRFEVIADINVTAMLAN
jgi:hypothetical protein